MPVSRRRRPTSTSAFGVGRRESHDASGFYDRFTAPVLSDDDALNSSPIKDKIVTGDARHMDEVEDASVALVVTSPPYFAGKEYEEALGEGHIPASYLDYLGMLTDVFAECVRTLEPGGRIAVNVANLGRKPYRSLSADVIAILQDRLGLLLRGEVVWHKARGASGSCAWGSFRSPANPVLRDLTERVVIASKGRFDRALSRAVRQQRGLPSGISLTKEEFIEATTDVWELPSERATRVGHPAPFPVELPLRLIELFTYEGDLVLDPFIGSGTTAAAAVRSHRHFVGYDTESEYVRIAEQRVSEERERLIEHEGQSFEQARRDGSGARELAGEMLRRCGFFDVAPGRRPVAGVEIAYTARDRTGRQWLFDFSGAFTTANAGLRRADTLWRALGKAAVVHAAWPEVPFVLLTTAAPAPGSSGDRAWRSLGEAAPPGEIGAVYDVIELGSPEGEGRLCGYASRGLQSVHETPHPGRLGTVSKSPRRAPRAR
ncbi:MAG TPA: site-specific DNA-methyltransferase [Acidimicrobiales bacterium]|nr:site-specific DNA-methyltransferase [Acidimicrobiales bacterium]